MGDGASESGTKGVLVGTSAVTITNRGDPAATVRPPRLTTPNTMHATAPQTSINVSATEFFRVTVTADIKYGVERSFAVQAGREVRILVRPEEIDDLTASRLARDIVRKIEEQLTYPGQIKVTVIRETRAVEYAK